MSEHSKERKMQEKNQKKLPNNDSCGGGNTRRSSALVFQSLLSRLNMQT